MKRFKCNIGSVLYLILIILMIVIILNIAFRAKGISKENVYQGYSEYVVQAGDTIWNIARECNMQQDIRKTVFNIRIKNKLDSPIIFPGQTLLIPREVK